MKDIDPLFTPLKREPIARPAEDFNAAVWSKIVERRNLAAVPWWAIWEGPRMAAAGAAAALAVGVGAAFLATPRPIDRRAALGLEAFGTEAPNLPATLIARQK